MSTATLPLFSIGNHQCDDCGTPPTLPPDFETGPYRRSYFENRYGEQWLFRYNTETKEVVIHGGDCGWEAAMSPLILPIDKLHALMTKAKVSGIGGQFVLAGVCLVSNVLKGGVPNVTLVYETATKVFVTLNEPERLWVQACMGTTVDVEQKLTDAEIVTMLAAFGAPDSKKKAKKPKKS